MKTMTTPELVRCNGDWVEPRRDWRGKPISCSVASLVFCIDLLADVVPGTCRADAIKVHMQKDDPVDQQGWYLLDHNPFEGNDEPEEKYVVQSLLHPMRMHYVHYFYEGARKYLKLMDLPLYFHVEITEFQVMGDD